MLSVLANSRRRAWEQFGVELQHEVEFFGTVAFYGTALLLAAPFALARYEVTQELYQVVMGANPSNFKGDDRPVNTLEDRLAVVAALESVALVTWFDEDTPIERIVACRPDHLVKGGDWATDKIVGASEVTGWGGKVHSIPFRHDRSTTELLSRIRK